MRSSNRSTTDATLGNRATARGPVQCRCGDARGLEVSPGSLLKYELVERQIRDRFAQSSILELKLLQPLYLFDLQSAEFLAPAIVGHLAHADLADRIRHALSLRCQNVNLPKLGNNLFSFVTLPCHCGPPGCQRHSSSRTTSMGVDHGLCPRLAPHPVHHRACPGF